MDAADAVAAGLAPSKPQPPAWRGASGSGADRDAPAAIAGMTVQKRPAPASRPDSGHPRGLAARQRQSLALRCGSGDRPSGGVEAAGIPARMRKRRPSLRHRGDHRLRDPEAAVACGRPRHGAAEEAFAAGAAAGVAIRSRYGSCVLPAGFGVTTPSLAFSDCARSSNSAA